MRIAYPASSMRHLNRRLSQAIAIALSLSLVSVPAIPAFQRSAEAAVDKRTISMYFVHTKEKIKVTYKRDGRYDKAALKKINHFLRDWRAKQSTRMDPKVIDLLWELHNELGSKKPVHIISAFRSSKTNKMLRRIGRNVARRSMHTTGRAIDFYFPDVPIRKLRESALLRERGGVGYYPRSGKYGFVHIDTGRVRHWPRMSKKQLARLFRNKKTRQKPAREKPILVAKREKTVPAKPNAKPIVLAASTKRRVPVPRLNPNRDTAITTNTAQRRTIVAQALTPMPVPRLRPGTVQVAEAPATPAPAEPSIRASLDDPLAVPRPRPNPTVLPPAPPAADTTTPIVVANVEPPAPPSSVVVEPAAVSPVPDNSNVVAALPSPARSGLKVEPAPTVVAASTSPVIEPSRQERPSFWQTLFPGLFSSTKSDDGKKQKLREAPGTRVASLSPTAITGEADDVAESDPNLSSHGKGPVINRNGKADRLYAVPLTKLAVIELPGDRRILLNRGNKADSLVPVQDRDLLVSTNRKRTAAPQQALPVTPKLQAPKIASLRTSTTDAAPDQTGAAISDDLTLAGGDSIEKAETKATVIAGAVPKPRPKPKRDWLKVNLDPIRQLFR